MSLADYCRRHRNQETGEDPPTGWNFATMHKGIYPEIHDPSVAKPTTSMKDYDPVAGVKAQLSPKELQTFEERFRVLFIQADEDPALLNAVQNIVLDQINGDRYKQQIAAINARMISSTKGASPNDMKQLQVLHKLAKEIEETNLKMMDSLNLTRAKKQARRQSVQTTPSQLVSGLETLRRTLPAEQLERLNQEMEEAAQRLRRNEALLKETIPQDVVLEQNDSELV